MVQKKTYLCEVIEKFNEGPVNLKIEGWECWLNDQRIYTRWDSHIRIAFSFEEVGKFLKKRGFLGTGSMNNVD